MSGGDGATGGALPPPPPPHAASARNTIARRVFSLVIATSAGATDYPTIVAAHRLNY
jgi:hypothetical protein